jgi:hypothetical protein
MIAKTNRTATAVALMLAAIVALPVIGRAQTADATAKAQALQQLRQTLVQDKAAIAGEKASLQADRRRIASLRKALRGAQAVSDRTSSVIRKWICNAYKVEHDNPSQCSNPEQGGRWITQPNPNYDDAQRDLRNIQQSLADAERQYAADKKALDSKTAQLTADTAKLKDATSKAGLAKRPTLQSGDPAAVRDYTQKVVDRTWSPNAAKAADNLKSDADLSAALTQAAQGKKYVKDSDLKAIVTIESTANRNTGINKFGYAGLFQMGKTAAKDVGYNYDDIKDPKDWKTNVAAGAKYLEKNAERLAQRGLPVNAINIYLSHQQGPGNAAGTNGAPAIIKAVQDGTAATIPANNNMLNNLPNSYKAGFAQIGQQVTVQDYYNYWSDAFAKVNSAVNGTLLP